MENMSANEEIDPRVIPLVEELNRFPGVETFASCGGHRHVHLKGFKKDDSRAHVGQVRLPDFYVSFMIEQTAEAFWSLRLISWAAYEASGAADVRYGAVVMMWSPTPEPTDPPRFDLYGKVDVQLVVKMLERAREKLSAMHQPQPPERASAVDAECGSIARNGI
jgi:hypothetical protein